MRGLQGYPGQDVAFEGSASILRGRFVKVTAPHRVGVAGAGEAAVGVALEAFDPTRDRGVLVRVAGVAEVVAGAAIAAGAEVQVGAGGKAVPLTGGGKRVGIAITSASGDGYTLLVLLK